MAGLVTLWGARLTFNFARKGGYTGARGLPLAGAARPDEPAAVRGLQPALHRALPERDPGADHPAGAHGVREPRHRSACSTSCSPCCSSPCSPARRWPTSSSGSSSSARSAEVAAGATPAPRFLQTGLFAVLAASQLLLRAGAVVGAVPLRRRRRRLAAAVDGARARCCSPCCSSARRSSPRASRSRSTRSTPTTRRRTSAVVPWFPRRARQEAARRPGLA